MTEKLNEQISALLDNELSTVEAKQLLERLRDDSTLQTQWDRYHLIGDAIRGEADHVSALSVVDAVHEQLIDEPVIVSAPAKSRQRQAVFSWPRLTAGVALAASVAFVAVMVAPYFNQPADDVVGTHLASAPIVVPSTIGPVYYSVSAEGRWKNLAQPNLASKLDGYLAEHSEYASSGGIGGVLPYAAFISYDPNK